MQALSLVGSTDADLLPAVAARLDGRVATVSRGEVTVPDAPDSPDGDTTHPTDADITLSDEGDWSATVTDDSFDRLLDRLAPEYDYALIEGFSRLRLPTVVVGDSDGDEPVPGDVVRRVADADDLDPDDLADLIASVEPHVTLETLVEEAKQAEGADRSGAIATFTGRVRAKDAPDDDRTEYLAFEKYEGVAGDRLAAIESELEERDGVFDVQTHHRVGVIKDGEDIVFVVVLAGHREEAFRTVSDGIDRLKDEVPIFKKESTVSEEFWVHDRE
jgi:molybdopterin synthase catalytic subunit